MNMKKAFKVLTAVVIGAALLTGCTPESPAETTKGSESGAKEFTFVWKGTDVTPGKDCKKAVEALGTDYKYFSGADCAYEGMNSVYDYTDVTLYAYTDKNGTDEIISIVEVKGADLKTPEGVGNGDTPDKVKEVYGEAKVENKGGLLYQSGNIELSFFVKDGVVSSMTYAEVKGE